MSSASPHRVEHGSPDLDADALFVALVLAPATYSRNKFFELFQKGELRLARRRAQLLRSVVKDLTEPWPHPGEIPSHPSPVITEEAIIDGNFHMTYIVEELDYRRSVVLSGLEAATLRYALHRAGHGELDPEDKSTVEACLARLAPLSDS